MPLPPESQPTDVQGWTVLGTAAFFIACLSYMGVAEHFRRSCVSLTPHLAQTLDLCKITNNSPLRRRIHRSRIPTGFVLALWPAAVLGVVLVLSWISTLDGISSFTQGLLPNFYSMLIEITPFDQSASRVGLTALFGYAIIRLPSTIAGQADPSPITALQGRFANVIAGYRVLRGLFVDQVVFGGDRERILTDIATDLCTEWFPKHSRYADERREAFAWLAKNSGLTDAQESDHVILFSAMERMGMYKVVNELYARIPNARPELRRQVDCELVLEREGVKKSAEKVRGDEFGCVRWNRISSFRLTNHAKLMPSDNYLLTRVRGKRLGQRLGLRIVRRGDQVALKLNEPSEAVARIVKNSLA